MRLCFNCLLIGYCRNTRTSLVTYAELKNPEFIRDLRETAFDEGVADTDWRDHVSDLYRDYRGWIGDDEANSPEDQELMLNMEEFEKPSIREWFRDFCCTPCPPHVNPRVRHEAWERVRVLATIMRARYPARASLWGVRPANHNRRPQS